MTTTKPQSQAAPARTETLSFPPFRVDLGNEQLWRGAELLPLRPKPFAVLRYLLTHAGQLVTKAELLQVIWPDTVGNAGLPKGCIRELRQVLGDKAESPRFIETVGRRGYRFIGTLTPQASGAPGQDRGRHRPPVSAREVAPLPPFVGRDAELEQLQGWLERATHGQRHCGFVTGEPGIGKTALVDAFCRRVQREGSVWAGRGQCIEHYGAGEAYGPVLEALGRLGHDHGDRLVPLLYHHAPTWLLQLPMLLSDADLAALQRRAVGTTQERMLRELAAALEVLTQERSCTCILRINCPHDLTKEAGSCSIACAIPWMVAAWRYPDAFGTNWVRATLRRCFWTGVSSLPLKRCSSRNCWAPSIVEHELYPVPSFP
jgi:DNA-binding winged helix-turn-helix (wHTH) protein